MTDAIPMPILPVLPGISLSTSQKTIPFPTNKTITQSTKKIVPRPKTLIEITPLVNNKFSVVPKESLSKTSTFPVQGGSPLLPVIVTKDTINIENELHKLEYSVISKIFTQKLKFLKAINNKGQKVYIYIDVQEYSSITDYDIMIIENDVNSLSYSIKNGAYNCVGTDVTGVVFEYGINSICTIIRGENDLKFNETNYVFNYKNQSHNLSFEGCVITYPIIKLSELRVNSDIILCNTDIVTRRLRNAEDSYERQELAKTDSTLEQLNEALCNFKETCNNSTRKLICSIEHLKNLQEQQCNEELQNDLIKSNDNIVKLICVMKKVASKRKEMEKITYEIKELTDYLSSQI